MYSYQGRFGRAVNDCPSLLAMHQRASTELEIGAGQMSMALAEMYPGRITLITGENEKTQNIVAMAHVGMAVQDGRQIFHNGCSREGWRISLESLSSSDKFSELLSHEAVKDGSLFVLADADCISALKATESKDPPQWLKMARNKGLDIILTTVRGREYMLRDVLRLEETVHVLIEYRSQGDGVIGTHYHGKMDERVPIGRTFLSVRDLTNFAELLDGRYERPERDESELIINPHLSPVTAADYEEAVRSTETSKPKHHAYNFLLTRVLVMYPGVQVRVTEMVFLPWIESVDKYNIEKAALNWLDYACGQWGIALSEVEPSPAKDEYPDGLGKGLSGQVNIEVTKVQPVWPSEATFSRLASSALVGKEARPKDKPVVQCKQCGASEADGIYNVHSLPAHDESHDWVCTYPKSLIGSDWDNHIVALPELKLTQESFEERIDSAAQRKSNRVERYGGSNQNWLVLIVEGFPVEPDWYKNISSLCWERFDGVFMISTEEFFGAFHGMSADVAQNVIVVKCPESRLHVCYHPGVVLSLKRGSASLLAEFQGLEKIQGRTIEITNVEGAILAKNEVEPPQPFTHLDLTEGLRGVDKKRREFSELFNVSSEDSHGAADIMMEAMGAADAVHKYEP